MNIVEVSTDQGATLVLPLEDNSEGLTVKGIEGLDPVKANLVSSSYAQVDGAQYQTSRRETRNIILTLGLGLNSTTGTVRDLRRKLYSFFMPKTQVRLRFMFEGAPIVIIYARIETFESPLFTQEPEATISLLCFDPDFQEELPTLITATTTDVTDMTEYPVVYSGTVETGILLTMFPDRTMTDFSLYHRSSDDQLNVLDFAASLLSGDILQINTNSGEKGAQLVRDNTSSSLLYGIPSTSNWINLFPGTNYLRVTAGGVAVPYTIQYTNRHGGL